MGCVLVLWGLLGGVVADEVKPAPTNILLLIADDQAYTDYGFMGNEIIATPNLDRMASESLVYRRGYVPSSVCAPSLASLITGRYPHEHRITGNDPPSPGGKAIPGGPRGTTPERAEQWDSALTGIPTLPRILGDRGYLSLQTGKWWHGDYAKGGFTHGMTRGIRHGDDGLIIGRETMEPIERFIRDCQQTDRPFLIWYAPFLPHAPHNPPERLLARYRDRTESLAVAQYWAMCEWFDETCGSLLNLLDREGLTDTTLVVFVCDNGWIQSPNEANRFAPKNKTTPYDIGHRTPILFRLPGKISPAVSDRPVSSIDILPTILEVVGMNPPANLPGVSLLEPDHQDPARALFGACSTHRLVDWDEPARNLLWRWVLQDEVDARGQTHQWRLIVPRTAQANGFLAQIPEDPYITPDLMKTLQDARPLLFDVAADPQEEQDLASEHPEVVDRLLRQLDEWWKPSQATGTQP